VGQIIAGVGAGLWLVAKAGGFGSANTLLSAIDMLRAEAT
jgi:hypothetical protein